MEPKKTAMLPRTRFGIAQYLPIMSLNGPFREGRLNVRRADVLVVIGMGGPCGRNGESPRRMPVHSLASNLRAGHGELHLIANWFDDLRRRVSLPKLPPL
jgi:hypothetical protein